MPPAPTKPIELSTKDKFNTLFAGSGLMAAIAFVLGVFAFGGEHSSQIVFIIWIVVNLVFYGFVIKGIVVGYQSWNKLQKVLPNGALTMARCTESKHYSYDDSLNRTYKLTYQFEVDGKVYSFTTSTIAKVRLPLPVFYDQTDPDQWISLSMLPDSMADKITAHYSQRVADR